MSPRRIPRPPVHAVVGTAYVLAMAGVAALAAWPIYRAWDFVFVVVAATVAGTGIAIVSRLFRWPGWLTVLTVFGAFLAIGVLFAVPARALRVPSQWPGTILEVLSGAVTGWKDLITVDLPVGGYRNLLVPVLVVFLVGITAAMRLSWLTARRAVFGAVVALAMVFFGLAFGRPFTSDALTIGPIIIPAPLEILTGSLGLLLTLGWLSWLAFDERRQALRRAANTTGVRVSRRRTGSDTRRGALAAGMIAVALLVAGAAGPAVAAGLSRSVLRSEAGPQLEIERAESPLATYREAFADDRYDDVLFRVDSEGTLPERIRIATLTSYNGVLYRALDRSASLADARFVRVPSRLDAGAGEDLEARVTIQLLGGIWLPTFGRVEEVRFSGDDSARLSDSFYYNASASAAVETASGGLAVGDSYVVSAVVPDVPELASITAPGLSGAVVPPPESLVTWIEAQGVGSDGAALAELIARLRDRGYLSHALSVSEETPPAWMGDLGEYSFQPSAAGHSLARIDTLFRQLLDRAADAASAGADASLVAAIGDDEQFAVAGALIAQHLGFPSRVVIGTRLSGAQTDIPLCDGGVCQASDLTAWIEVESSTGQWIPIDVTPQHSEPVEAEVRHQRDPENETEVRPEAAEEVVPPDPLQQDAADDDDGAENPPLDLSALWAGLRIAAAGALVLALAFGPFAIIVLAKTTRRRRRRADPDARVRVVGGWEEYVDAAVDNGLPGPGTRTRGELADLHERTAVKGLAVVADRAVFSDGALTPAEAAAFWRIVDAERLNLAEDRSVWQKFAAAVSLKSFTRSLAPRTGRGRAAPERRTERRTHRPGDDVESR